MSAPCGENAELKVAEPKTEIRHPDLRDRYQVTACLPAIGRDWLAFLLPGHSFPVGCFPLFPVISRGWGVLGAGVQAPLAGNPGKVYKIPLLPGQCVKRSVLRRSRRPPGSFRLPQMEPMPRNGNDLRCEDRVVFCLTADSIGRMIKTYV